MKTRTPLLITLGGALAALIATLSASDDTRARDALVERGRHIVEDVALCTDCHAPRLSTGEFDREHWLMGSPLPFKPTIEMPWAPAAPPIAGLTAHTDEEAVMLLTTGVRANGTAPLPPMPSFKLSRDEAEAVVAYLRSVAPAR